MGSEALLPEGGVGRELGITPRALRNHVPHANRKRRTRHRLETVIHAIRRGII